MARSTLLSSTGQTRLDGNRPELVDDRIRAARLVDVDAITRRPGARKSASFRRHGLVVSSLARRSTAADVEHHALPCPSAASA
jgi:hypothetical protein